jgi:solute carrier family 8 (sodium/calcium exchanger)
VDVVVSRIEGCSGEIGCSYRTIDGDAMAGPDYTSTSGTLTFAAGQAKKVVSIPIINSEVYEKDEVFKLELFSPTGGTGFGEGPTGAALATVACEIKITSDESAKETVDTIASLVKLPINQHAFDHAAATWSEQFRDALDVNGGETVEVPAGAVPWTLHVLSLPWKLLFACVPPVHIASGKLAFFVALSFIGGVTAVIGDIAGLFGCLLGLPDAITAITFVAMGTSLPDTFASRAAAMNDANADASIVNVTGSNAVNVFLGLGLPWLIGAVYWWLKGPSSAWAARYPEQAARFDGRPLWIDVTRRAGF